MAMTAGQCFISCVQTESYAVAVSSKRFDWRGCRGLIWGSNWYQFNCFDKWAHEIQN